MVYLHFPSALTEEELALQAKYAKLKKKKKALQAHKAPKQEPEKPILPKRPTEARDAREIARKLLKSGAIQAIKSPPPLPQNATFKRPRAGRERKLSGPGTPITPGGVASYQPFSASQEAPPPDEKASPRVKYLYDSFVTSREKEGREEKQAAEREREPQKPRNGNTLFVSVPHLPEEALRKRVMPYAPVNVTVESEKNRGFLTFETAEIAAKVLAELDGTACEDGGQPMRVSFARRQPAPPRTGADPASSQAWSALAAHHPQKSTPAKDKERSMVTYDDIFD